MQTPGLTPRQTALLVASYQVPGATIADLADRIDLDRNTTAEMTARLVERELLRREPSPSDRRAWSVFIAPAGEAILREVLPRNEELMQRLLEPLPPEYRPLFVKSLRLVAGLEPAEPGSAEREDPGRSA
ncbi:MAG: MarR family transcriptional regulator [Actinobacteria bacterium]|nr:MarR family transcriptional regulator [Actinomycetota bacterium]